MLLHNLLTFLSQSRDRHMTTPLTHTPIFHHVEWVCYTFHTVRYTFHTVHSTPSRCPDPPLRPICYEVLERDNPLIRTPLDSNPPSNMLSGLGTRQPAHMTPLDQKHVLISEGLLESGQDMKLGLVQCPVHFSSCVHWVLYCVSVCDM